MKYNKENNGTQIDRKRAYLKAWEAEHKEWRKDYNRRYYLAHRDEFIRRARERHAAHKDR